MKKNSGAVSVQAVFMMLVLVTLGAFAITSARVNYVFSMKALEWNRMYYALEDKAERFVKEVDSALISSGGAENASEALDGLTIKYPESAVVIKEDGLYAEIDLKSDDNEDANLRVALKINDDPGDPRRYIITEWTQWQNVSDDYEEMSLWDGSL